jgi:uncharacterized BrkB/YihY/UPF0761 family membrane protein
MMSAIRGGLDVALHVEHTRPPARGKLVDLVLVVSCSLLVLVTVAVTVLDKLAQHALRRVASEAGVGGPAPTWIPRPISLIALIVIVMLLYRLVPSRRMRPSDALAGAITTAVLLLAISFASGRVYEGVTQLSVVYGSLTTALVFLYSVYLYASALLFGGEVAAAWSANPASDGEPVVVKLRRALRGLFVGADATRPPPNHRG